MILCSKYWVYLLLFATAVLHGSYTYDIYTDPGSQLTVKLTPGFEEMPRRGFLPIFVEIMNGSGSSKTWQVRSFGSSQFDYALSAETRWKTNLTVPAGQRRTFEIQIPLIEANYNSSLFIKVTGPSTDDGISLDNVSYMRGGSFSIGSNSILRKRSFTYRPYLDLVNLSLASGTGTFDSRITSWRGFAGVDLIWFSQREWEALKPENRSAILDWVAQGGEFRLLKDKGVPADMDVQALPISGEGISLYGTGLIHVFPYMDFEDPLAWDNSSVQSPEERRKLIDEVVSRLDEPEFQFWILREEPIPDKRLLLDELKSAPSIVTPLDQFYSPPEVEAPLVIASVIGFALVIGPVNFWVLARGRNRFRLIFTTPVIAGVFCFLIVLLILFSDGIGGEGRIGRFIILMPETRQEVRFESRYAMTGMLLNRSFRFAEGSWTEPLGSWVTGGLSMQIQGTYGNEGTKFWGNWFGSRRVQGLSTTQVQPSRSEFEIRQGVDGPVVISSFPGFLPELYLVGPEGKTFYAATNVLTGKPANLDEVSERQFIEWVRNSFNRLDQSLLSKIQNLSIEPSQIYASIESYAGDDSLTLNSISWENYQSIVTSPVDTTGLSRQEAGE